jgi:hypothetical protein
VSGQDIAHTASLHEIVCPPLGGKYHPQNAHSPPPCLSENRLLLSGGKRNKANSAEIASTANDEVWAVGRDQNCASSRAS